MRTAHAHPHATGSQQGASRIRLLPSRQPLECQPPVTPQQPGGSASDLLQSYIDRFDRTGEVVDRRNGLQSPSPAPAPSLKAGGYWEKLRPPPPPPPPPLSPPPQLPSMEDDTETLELLCGWSGSGDRLRAATGVTAASDAHVSVKTRRILQDVDKQLGHWQPCYSAPDKLDLRTKWPSMHEHLERRWRQQLRARYEARLKEEAEATAAAKAAQGSRADLYSWTGGSRRWQTLQPAQKHQPQQHQPQQQQQPAHHRLRTGPETRVVEPDDEDEDSDDDGVQDDGDDGTEKAGSVDNEIDAGGDGGSLAEDDEEEEEEVGRPWGSDSGLGLSCIAGEKQMSPKEAAVNKALPVVLPDINDPDLALDHKDEDEDSDRRSFEERMRSYRCVLEAHELSAQLRQRLEVACAVGGGPRALTADQKGRIRDRLARLQHPELVSKVAVSAESPQAPSDDDAQQRLQKLRKQQEQQAQHEEQQQRITTERLTRLMGSARGLLAESDGRLTSCQRLCDSVAAGQQRQQQELKAPANGSS